MHLWLLTEPACPEPGNPLGTGNVFRRLAGSVSLSSAQQWCERRVWNRSRQPSTAQDRTEVINFHIQLARYQFAANMPKSQFAYPAADNYKCIQMSLMLACRLLQYSNPFPLAQVAKDFFTPVERWLDHFTVWQTKGNLC